MRAPVPVILIGRGRIGGAVADWLGGNPRYRLVDVIGRRGGQIPAAPPDIPGLVLETAGPGALADWGERALAWGEVWSVGAAALLDAGLRARLQGPHPLRLFTPWISGPALAPPGTPATLHIEQSAPGLAPAPGLMFDGPLTEAARRFPHHLNTATAAALAGPGLAATRVALHCSPPGGAHVIRARFSMPGQSILTEVTFPGDGPHPVAQALIAALARRDDWLRLGAG